MMIDDESMHIVNTKVDSKKKSWKVYVAASWNEAKIVTVDTTAM